MIDVAGILGKEAEYLLNHTCRTFPGDRLHLPGPDFIDRVQLYSDRPPAVLRNLQLLFNNGRIGKTGYLSILPVDQSDLLRSREYRQAGDRGRLQWRGFDTGCAGERVEKICPQNTVYPENQS
jgi:hypothetical protein